MEKVGKLNGWVHLINEKFTVVLIMQTMIKDFNDLFKKTVTKDRLKFQITKYKLFIFKAARLWMEASVTLQNLISDNFGLLKSRAANQIVFPTKPLNNEDLPINKEKLQNILQLVKYLIDPEAILFYKGLKASQENQNDDMDD